MTATQTTCPCPPGASRQRVQTPYRRAEPALSAGPTWGGHRATAPAGFEAEHHRRDCKRVAGEAGVRPTDAKTPAHRRVPSAPSIATTGGGGRRAGGHNGEVAPSRETTSRWTGRDLSAQGWARGTGTRPRGRTAGATSRWCGRPEPCSELILGLRDLVSNSFRRGLVWRPAGGVCSVFVGVVHAAVLICHRGGFAPRLCGQQRKACEVSLAGVPGPTGPLGR